jgi:flavin-dependent dehydrogenase
MLFAIAAGGGLGGCAFALEIVCGGGRAMIIEKSAGPHHKVCGEFLSENTALLLRHLHVDCDLLGSSKIAKLRLADGTSEATAPLPFPARGLSRFRLDEALIGAAAAAGVEVLRGTAVEGISEDGGVRVETTRGTFRGDAVALASGKHNVRGFSRPGGPLVGFKMHVMPSAAVRQSLYGVVQLHAFDGGYGGFCLVEEGVLSLAWNIHVDTLRSVGSSWGAQMAHLAKTSPVFGDLIAGAKTVWEKPLAVSGQPYGFLRSAPVGTSVYPVGDQLAVIPSFVGDGTALALASGIAAARAVLNGQSAQDFQRRIVAGHRPQFRIAGALDLAISNAALRRLALAGARLAPRAVTSLIAASRLRGFDDVISSAREADQRSSATM